MSTFSVFIPRVFANITKERISKVFSSLTIGDATRIDLHKRVNKKGESYNIAFVHLTLYDNQSANSFKELVESEKESRLVYDDPWYWIVLPFKEKEPNMQQQHLNPMANMWYPIQQPMMQQMQMNEQGYWYYPQMMPMQQYPIAPMLHQQQYPIAPTLTEDFTEQERVYGNRNSNQRPHPRKRINVPKMDQDSDKEDGEC